MMNITVLQVCDSSQREIGEEDTKLLWCDQSPQLKQRVSMGHRDDWQIVEVVPYYPRHDSVLDVIYFAFVDKKAVDVSEWNYLCWRETSPKQALELRIEDPGSNFLGWSVNVQGDLPKVGDYLVSYGLSEQGLSTRAEPWLMTAFDTFTSSLPRSPFDRIFLAHHRIQPVRLSLPLESCA